MKIASHENESWIKSSQFCSQVSYNPEALPLTKMRLIWIFLDQFIQPLRAYPRHLFESQRDLNLGVWYFCASHWGMRNTLPDNFWSKIGLLASNSASYLARSLIAFNCKSNLPIHLSEQTMQSAMFKNRIPDVVEFSLMWELLSDNQCSQRRVIPCWQRHIWSREPRNPDMR